MMKRTVKTIGIALVLSVFLFTTKSCEGADSVIRTSDRKTITFEEMVGEIGKAKVIFLGESHDSKRDHEAELAVIKGLHKSGTPLAVGLEMFRAEDQRTLDQWVRNRVELAGFLKSYYDNWGFPWPLYKDIFLYARDNGIPLIGLNVPAAITRKVSRQGFSSLDADELKQLPPGISCSVDERYMEFIRRAYGAHGMQDKSFVNFCEAQMVWDKAMAWHLVAFLKKNPGRVVVVLAGIGHAWKRGIPEQLAQLSGPVSRVILPELPERIDRTTILSKDADYILLR